MRLRKENQIYSSEEQRALSLIALEENKQKEAALIEYSSSILKYKKRLSEKGARVKDEGYDDREGTTMAGGRD